MEFFCLIAGVFVIILIIVAIVVAYYDVEKNSKKRDEFQKIKEESINDKGIVKSVEYEWSDSLGGKYYGFIADDVNKNVYISNKLDIDSMECIPYKKILGFETTSDFHKEGGVGRAITGGVLAGGAGAVVGAQTAKEKTQSYKAIIYLDDVSKPKYEMEFLGFLREATYKSPDYVKAVEFTSNVNAVIKAIVANNSIDNTQTIPVGKEETGTILNNSSEKNDTKEQLTNLKELYESDLITKEEYEAKKKQILGL